jgi:hypothetical protein
VEGGGEKINLIMYGVINRWSPNHRMTFKMQKKRKENQPNENVPYSQTTTKNTLLLLLKQRNFAYLNNKHVRFEIFTVVTMKNSDIWDVTPCGSCKNRRFGGS